MRNSSFYSFFCYNLGMTILGIGQSVYDILYPIDQFEKNKKYRVNDSVQCMGGPVTCAMALCGKWKADVKLCSRVGKDTFGKEIIEQLKEYGVDSSYIFMDKKDSTSISSILIDESGNRTILNHPMTFESAYPFDLPEACDVLLFDGHEVDLSLKALNKYTNVKTIFDGDKYKPETMKLIHNVDYLVCSLQFAQEITGHPYDEKMYSELCAINSNHVVLTLGEKGCVYKDKMYPAYPCEVKDTTGAGDIFHGAFAYGLDQNWPIEKIISVSSMASSLACEKVGGVPGIPSLEEVKNLLYKM